MTKLRKKGDEEEAFVAHYLTQHGLKIIARNYFCKLGEIDLIATHNQYLVFVEVRQRKDTRFGSPLESISLSKQQKLRKAAEHYIITNNVTSRQAMRFDAVGLTGILPNVQVEWLQNAF